MIGVFIDIEGQKFNKLTVLRKSDKKGSRGETYWECLCDCGKNSTVRSDALRKGRILSCGCINSTNLIGQKFNLLTVVEETKERGGQRGAGEKIWLCKCDCGNYTKAATSKLTHQGRKSCGCLKNQKGIKHHRWTGCGEISGDIWRTIIHHAKCRSIAFLITVEDGWQLFEKQNRCCALTGWAIYFQTKNDRTASLDRIDSSKPYTLDNVQWVHKDINMMKRSHSVERFVELCRAVAKHTEKSL